MLRSAVGACLLLLALSLPAFKATAMSDREQLLHIVKEHGFQGSNVGLWIEQLAGSADPIAVNADRGFIPASTIKVVTAVVANAVLGGDHRFSTELYRSGGLEDGLLSGDLYLRGDGDPRLEPENLLDLAIAVKRLGIRRVSGKLFIDDTAFPRAAVINEGQPDDPYNAGIGSLMVGFNRTMLHWHGRSSLTVPPLLEATVEIAKAGGDATVINRQKQAGVYRWHVRPMRANGKQALPVADAGLHAAGLLRRFLIDQDVEVGEIERAKLPDSVHLIARHRGPELRTILRDMLHYSNNQIAEMVGMAAASTGGKQLDADEVGPLAAAARHTVDQLREMLPSTDWHGIRMSNHSGLEPNGRLTPRQMAALLAHGYDRVNLPALMPAAAYSGTLAKRFIDTDQALRVWAKTGSVFYGSAIAGYLFPANRQPLIIVIMVSDLAARAAFDERPDRHLVLAPEANQWSLRARALQDEIIGVLLAP